MKKQLDQIDTIKGWKWLYDNASYGDIVDSIRNAACEQAYNYSVSRMARTECGFEVVSEESPIEYVLSIFPDLGELEDYGIEADELPGWFVVLLRARDAMRKPPASRMDQSDVPGIKKAIEALEQLNSDQSETIARLQSYLDEIARDGYSRDLSYAAWKKRQAEEKEARQETAYDDYVECECPECR